MQISVIIPHFNQEDYLLECLCRLQAQSSGTASIEIIVVDNGSRRMPEAVCNAFLGVRLLREATAGPGPARNTGAAHASGDILAFIDADCHADAQWLATIERCFHSTSSEIVGGDVRVGYADPANPTFVEPYEAIYSFRNQAHIAEGFSGTGNMAVRREIFDRVGPFGGIDIAEDREWGLRAKSLGYSIAYEPEMIVYHPARRSFSELQRKWDRHIAHDFQERVHTASDKLKWLLRAIAMVGSPLVEVPVVLRTDRISGWRERRMAFVCLCAIRLHRSKVMLRSLLRAGDEAAGTWRST